MKVRIAAKSFLTNMGKKYSVHRLKMCDVKTMFNKKILSAGSLVLKTLQDKSCQSLPDQGVLAKATLRLVDCRKVKFDKDYTYYSIRRSAVKYSPALSFMALHSEKTGTCCAAQGGAILAGGTPGRNPQTSCSHGHMTLPSKARSSRVGENLRVGSFVSDSNPPCRVNLVCEP